MQQISYNLFSPTYIIVSSTAICLLSNDIYDYHFVSQGKVTVPSIDDKEDMQFTHVIIINYRYYYLQENTLNYIVMKRLYIV